MTTVFSSAEAENQVLIGKINACIGRPFFKEGKYSVSKRSLPFYAKKTELVRAMNFATLPNISRTFLCSGDDIFETDGTTEAVLEANEMFSLKLTKENVTDYAAFFFDRIRTPDGRFKLIRSFDDIPFSSNMDDEPADDLKAVIEHPVVTERDGAFWIAANILYASVLYRASIRVALDGETTVEHEEPVMEDLPVERLKLR